MPSISPLEGSPVERVGAFVNLGRRRAATLGIDFASGAWEVSRLEPPVHGRPRAECMEFVHFTKKGSAKSVSSELMHPSVIDFAKAYIALDIGRLGTGSLINRRDAFRSIGLQLESRKACSITDCTVGLFDDAAAGARSSGTAAGLNHGVQLGLIAEFLDMHGMVSMSLAGWHHGCMAPPSAAGTAGPAFDAHAAASLPSPEFKAAMAEAAGLAEGTLDVIVTCVGAILASGPFRINEVLNLGENCLTERAVDGEHRVLLRSPGSKGSPPGAIWIQLEVAELMRWAVCRLHEVTADARAIKRWYDAHPGVLYLPNDLEHLRGRELLTLAEASRLLGPTERSIYPYARRTGLRLVRGGMYFMSEVERHILGLLDHAMFHAGGPRNHPLMLIKRGAFNYAGGGSPCMFEIVQNKPITSSLSPQRGQKSLFQRVGIDPRGLIRGRTHSFRHEHNTLALEGGASEDDVAEQSGRADPSNTSFYDHVSNSTINVGTDEVADALERAAERGLAAREKRRGP